ncbi:type II toxin-antitoxin system Phd/YefM family antitoxin [Dolichospermum sp. UHCC 0259]|jgi:prevent-host-death family protein|uniref:type II toxin-antitoxin system Phd/YefM family antitoxin n=1 Tax=Dolichospermum sp. UHCC 0259 TaxID=2590010 RepID=UPI0014451CFA|nr:type II toxin-antitoxin system prevent-host-death family antitoxin [Dolichospermum sp. UHCC 0259]MTJ47270.1 type II toxin-antitoxin system Phd/YefM family antitoxin [Dolichospermum sp. UHCC 0259]
MTINVSVPEATIQLTELLHRVRQGEEVIISEAGIPVARISPVYSKSPRIPGQDRGKVIISPDFDLPLPDVIINDFINPSTPQL